LGLLIRAQRGNEVRVRLVNELDEPTMVHWHGVRLANAMDGSALTQSPVAPGASFDYRFVVPDAGTFWYHASPAVEQESRGLVGALVVDHERPLDIDHDVVALLQDWPPSAT